MNLTAFLKEKLKFSSEEIELFTQSGELRKLNKKDFYIQEGKRALYKGFIQKGCTRTYFTDSNIKQNIIFFSFEGEWLGDIESYHINKPSRVTIQALEDCEILTWTKSTFDKLSETIPQLKQWYKYSAVTMYSNIFNKLIESKIRTLEEKYAYLLNEHPEIILRVPAQYIADYLEIEPQSFSRLRKRMIDNESY